MTVLLKVAHRSRGGVRRLRRVDVSRAALADVPPGAARARRRRRPGCPTRRRSMLDTADGEKVIVWYRAAEGGKPLVLYFQGNAGALRHRADRFRALTDDGFGLVALSYRGYGGSTGSPSEAGLIADAEAAYAFAAARTRRGAHRRVRRIARHRRCGCARGDAPGRRRRAGGAVHLGGRHRRRGLLVPAGAAADEGSVPLRRADRQGATRRCWCCMARATAWFRSRSASGCLRWRTSPSVSCGLPKARTTISTSTARWMRCGCSSAKFRLEAPVSAGAAGMASTKLAPRRRRQAARRGGRRPGAGMSVRADFDFVEATRSFLRRWVTPITVSAAAARADHRIHLDDR